MEKYSFINSENIFKPNEMYAFITDEKGEPTPPFKLFKKALKGYTKSFEIVNKLDPLYQQNETRKQIRTLLKSELEIMIGFKFTETIKITFEKRLDKDKTTYKTAYFN